MYFHHTNTIQHPNRNNHFNISKLVNYFRILLEYNIDEMQMMQKRVPVWNGFLSYMVRQNERS